MAALGAQTVASSYEQILHVDRDGGGNTTTHVSVKDGDNGTTFGFTIATDALMMTSTNRLEFGDNASYIHQSADGVLDLVSDTEIELTATTIDINGAVDMSSTLAVAGDANFDSNTLFVDASNNSTLIGTGTFRNNLFNTTLGSAFQIEGTDAQGSSMMVTRNTGASAGDLPFIALCKSRGSALNSNTIVADNDEIGSLTFQGNDGAEFVEAASIRGKIGGTPGSNDMPGELLFYTTADGATSGTLAMTIDSSQDATFASWISIAQGLIVNESGGDNDVRMESQNNDNMFRLDASTDRIGIGTASPTSALQIDGDYLTINQAAQNGIKIKSDDTGVIFMYDKTSDAITGGINFAHADGTMTFLTNGLNERMRITSGGNVGIGTASPGDYSTSADNLVIYDANHAGITIASPTDKSGNLFFADGTGDGDTTEHRGFIQYDHGNTVTDAMMFGTAGAERMRLDSSGNLGIGATSFGPRLYSIVDNDEFAAYFTSDSSSGSNAAVAIRADSSSGDRKLVAFWNGGGNVANITYNGSTATYGTGSDKRLKENIDDYSNGLSLLNKVEVKKFDWIFGRKQDVGVIAQDLNNIIPNVIVEGDTEEDIEEIWQVDYPRLVPYLINAVQELSAKVEALENA